MELQLEDLEASATEDELAAEKAAARTQTVPSFQRQRPVAQAVPRASAARAGGHRRAGRAAPAAGRRKLSKLGEDVTETLEVIPRQWKVIQTRAREVLVPRLRDDQPAAGAVPRHAARLGRPQPAGDDPVREVRPASAAEPPEPNATPAKASTEPVDAGRSGGRLRDGAAAAACADESHVLAAERLHGDDTTVPVLAKGKTVTGRIWIYVRDDRPFGGRAPPAALFYSSRDRTA